MACIMNIAGTMHGCIAGALVDLTLNPGMVDGSIAVVHSPEQRSCRK